jgi:pimeloyl-ACP methyl ester carboxylesterase
MTTQAIWRQKARRHDQDSVAFGYFEKTPDHLTLQTPLVILLHGFPDHPKTFFHHQLPNDAIWLAPMLPGLEEEKRKTIRPEVMILRILEIIQVYDPKKQRALFILGHDIGVVFAVQLAPFVRDTLRGVILSGGLPPEILAQRIFKQRQFKQFLKSWYLFAFQVPGLFDLISKLFHKRILEYCQKQGMLPEEKLPRGWENLVEHYQAFFRQWIKHPQTEFKPLRVPVLGIFGQKDAFIRPPTQSEWKQLSTEETTLRVLPSGHWAHISQGKEFWRFVHLFMQECKEKAECEPC